MPERRKPSTSGELLQLNAAGNREARRRQVKQYTEPDSNALPDQALRPTSLTKNLNLPFKSMGEYLPLETELPPEVVGKLLNELKLPMKLSTQPQVLKAGPNGGAMPAKGLNQFLGLGEATNGIGIDEQGKPYMSIYDLWDFAGEGGPLEWFLKNAGQPFNVYDRIPIDLQDGKLPKTVTTRGYKKDVNLPYEGKK
jgi:hypothetical protein